MATALKNLSDYDSSSIPNMNGKRIGIIVAKWNEEITLALCNGAIETLTKHGVKQEDIDVKLVPGSFELTSGSKMLADSCIYDAIIALGCVIQGETKHFDFICQGVTYGITELNLSYDIPFIFGVLTTDNLQQAKDRAGGIHGNKGDEAAITALEMIVLNESIPKD